MNNILIIGDKFVAFANGCTALTRGQFFQLSNSQLATVKRIVVGQGIKPEDLRHIYAFLAEKCLLSCVEVEEYISSKISPQVVHKRLDSNVMITQPKKLGDDEFSSYLVVEDDCAELSDHVTGIHMQGMLFVEAARQMFMAVSAHIGEKLGFENEKSQHALKEMQVNYKRFLYPMPIEVLLKIESGRELRRLGIFASEVSVQFKQFGEVGVEVLCKATTHDRRSLTHLEEIGASRQLEKLLANRMQMLGSGIAMTATI